MANNPYAVPLLMAMGLDEFSMSSSQILRVRSLINQLNTRKLQPLVHRAIYAETAAAVQKLVEKYVPQVKL